MSGKSRPAQNVSTDQLNQQTLFYGEEDLLQFLHLQATAVEEGLASAWSAKDVNGGVVVP